MNINEKYICKIPPFLPIYIPQKYDPFPNPLPELSYMAGFSPEMPLKGVFRGDETHANYKKIGLLSPTPLKICLCPIAQPARQASASGSECLGENASGNPKRSVNRATKLNRANVRRQASEARSGACDTKLFWR